MRLGGLLAGAVVVLALALNSLWPGLQPTAPEGTLTAEQVDRQESVPDAVLDLATVSLSALPKEAHATYRLILSGGPFPYERDGTVFFNRERLLPRQARGHYREYTVDTPGLNHRGARRIVCGGDPPNRPQTCFYTEDHYTSFRRILSGSAP